jgi:hypothetical protein
LAEYFYTLVLVVASFFASDKQRLCIRIAHSASSISRVRVAWLDRNHGAICVCHPAIYRGNGVRRLLPRKMQWTLLPPDAFGIVDSQHQLVWLTAVVATCIT